DFRLAAILESERFVEGPALPGIRDAIHRVQIPRHRVASYGAEGLAESARDEERIVCDSRGMLLYDSPVSGNCYKVRLLLAHLGIPYERRAMDVVDRSTRREVLGDLNPALRVPTLVLDDGRALGESGAILWYFGEDTRFVPQDRYERAQVLQWMFFEQYDLEPAIAVVRFWVAYSGRPEEFAD